MSADLPILIAGAGIGGLVAALALLRSGRDVIVCEQAPALAPLGAGVQLSANGTRVLIALGLEAALTPLASLAAGKEVRLYNTGQTWKLFDLGDESVRLYGAPYWLFHRGDLHEVLVDAVRAIKPDAIRLDHKVTGFTQDAGGVRLTFERGEAIEGSALIGGDGVHSVIQAGLLGDRKAMFMGVAAWRGVIPMERLPARFQRPIGTNWIGPGGHVITYPVRHNALFNFVAAIERDNWPVESWTARGTTEECAADFQGWHPDVLELVRAIDVPYKWALLGRDPLPRWSVGRVTLLGDAAHPTLPFLAQGANMAIEDGMVLARCFDEDTDDVPAALRRFERARLERTSAIVNRSNDNAKRFHNPDLGDPALAQAYVEREWQPEKVHARYDWLFRYDATTVAI